MIARLFAAALATVAANKIDCDEGLTPVGMSRGWLVYVTHDGRLMLINQAAGSFDPHVQQAVQEAFAQKAARDYVRKDST